MPLRRRTPRLCRGGAVCISLDLDLRGLFSINHHELAALRVYVARTDLGSDVERDQPYTVLFGV